MTLRYSLLVAAAALGATASMSAPAQAATNLGVLGCHSNGSTGYVVASRERLVCEFTPYGSGPMQLYAGTLDTYGISLGLTGRSTLTWAVVSVGNDANLAEGLQGTYVGASANASAFVGGGANALVGGGTSGFSLQPLSVIAQEGINAEAGVARLTLHPAQSVGAQQRPVAIPVTPGSAVPVAPPAR